MYIQNFKLFLFIIIFLLSNVACAREPASPSNLQVPPGFSIQIYATNVPGARSLALGAGGTVFVGTRKEGKVYALRDQNNDGKVDQVFTIASGLNQPNGVAFRNGSLYVAEVSRILRFDNIENQLSSPPKPIVVRSDFPTEGHHGWKFIAFGPDGKLYVPVGAPCNNCESSDPRFASITRMNPDGSGFEIFAQGIRNTVGFDWHPKTHELWFTDNGRDWMGNDLPPDELNRSNTPGMHFGYPYCHAGDFSDPEFGSKRKCSEFVLPVAKLGPHVAALGMRFYTGTMFPAEYRNQIFIAEHGSWNRQKKIGYRVMLVRMQGNQVIDYRPFAEGWLTEKGEVMGRPVDVLVMPDGALLISDDDAGVIYRVSFNSSKGIASSK